MELLKNMPQRYFCLNDQQHMRKAMPYKLLRLHKKVLKQLSNRNHSVRGQHNMDLR